jgi:hypothetical protein
VTSRGEFRAPGVGHVRSACPVPQLSAAYVRGLSRGLISLVASRDAGLRQPAMAPGACALLRRALLALAETRLHCLTAEYGILGVSRAPLPRSPLPARPCHCHPSRACLFQCHQTSFLCQARANATLDRSTTTRRSDCIKVALARP